jgi:hypothetical protein
MHPGLCPLIIGSIENDMAWVTESQPTPEAPTYSRVDGNLNYIESSACSVSYDGAVMGHTIGGVTLSIKPLMRERRVDEWGESVVDLVHTGDEVLIKTKFSERSMRTIRTVYQYGAEDTSTIWTFGRRPQVTGRAVAKQLILHPLSTGVDTGKDVTFYKAAVKENADVNVGTVGQDQVFEVTFVALVDDTKEDGDFIGRIGSPH